MANEGSTKPTYEEAELKKLAETVLDKYRLEEVYSRPDQIDAAETRFYAAATPRAILDLLDSLARVRGLLQRAKVGWMDSIDYHHELGDAWGGNSVYPDKENCEENHSCIGKADQDGIVDCVAMRVKVIDADELDKLLQPTNSETTVSPDCPSTQREQGGQATTADKSVEYSSQNPTFPQSYSLVSQGAESADIGKLDAVDKKHVCGQMGFNPSIGDTCAGCETRKAGVDMEWRWGK